MNSLKFIRRVLELINFKLFEQNLFASLLFLTGTGIIGFDVYETFNSEKIQFDLFASPIIGGILVVVATLIFRNNDSKRKRKLIFARGEILNEIRKQESIHKVELLSKLQGRFVRDYIEMALRELQAENLITIEGQNSNSKEFVDNLIIRTVDNSNLDRYKYEWALTLNQLDRRIDFGEELEDELKDFIRNPLSYSIGDANKLLSKIRTFLDSEE